MGLAVRLAWILRASLIARDVHGGPWCLLSRRSSWQPCCQRRRSTGQRTWVLDSDRRRLLVRRSRPALLPRPQPLQRLRSPWRQPRRTARVPPRLRQSQLRLRPRRLRASCQVLMPPFHQGLQASRARLSSMSPRLLQNSGLNASHMLNPLRWARLMALTVKDLMVMSRTWSTLPIGPPTMSMA